MTLLTIPEAAALLRVGEGTMRKLTREGVVKAVKIGGSIRIRSEELERGRQRSLVGRLRGK